MTDIIAMAPLLEGLNVQVFGGIALNSQNGGLNPHAVDRSLKMGGRMIWFPTISAQAHLDHAAHNAATQKHFQPMGMMQSQEVSVFDDCGDLKPVVHEIIGQAKELVALGATIEHDVAMYFDDKHFALPELLDWIDFIGPEHTSLGSHLGQVGNPLPLDGYKQILGKLLDSGIPEKSIRQMVSDNPSRLIGLN